MPHPHLTRDEAISIHALREEGDKNCRYCIHDESNFYPRPPRGGRPSLAGLPELEKQFLSTPSARRATSVLLFGVQQVLISIHALREEGDRQRNRWQH